jgi:maltose-binding protein MalE
MHLKNRILAVAAVILCVAAAVWGANRQMGQKDASDTGGAFFNGTGSKETIYFWYTDESMTSFFNSAAVSFGEREGVRVIPVLTSEGEYLEAINQDSLSSEEHTPDVYLIDNDSLEKAYLAGLASETGDEGTVCNTENFPQAALRAVNYHGKNIAYPLYFKTVALVYNETYLEEWAAQQEDGIDGDGIPQTVDDILNIADTFDVPEGVEGIMKWDVSDIFYNYWFVGRYMIVGGEAGDDGQNIDINNSETVQCLEVYQALNQFFSIESDTITYDSVIQDFIDGKVMFTVASPGIISRLEEAKEDGSFAYEYGIATMPDVSEELESSSLSVTGAVVVNGYSEHKELANRFAAYLVNDCAEELYARTGKLAARYNTDEDNGAAQIFKLEYADSVSLPKMIETGNFWLQLEVLFSKVWNGADVETQLQELADQIATQVVAD